MKRMQKSWKRCASDRIQSSEDAQAGFLEKTGLHENDKTGRFKMTSSVIVYQYRTDSVREEYSIGIRFRQTYRKRGSLMERRTETVIKLAQTALMAALCYVAFAYLKINIPMPGGDVYKRPAMRTAGRSSRKHMRQGIRSAYIHTVMIMRRYTLLSKRISMIWKRLGRLQRNRSDMFRALSVSREGRRIRSRQNILRAL